MREKRRTLPSVLLAILSTLGIFIGLLIGGFSLVGVIFFSNDTVPLANSELFTIMAVTVLTLTTCIINDFTLAASIRYLRRKPFKRLISPKLSSILIFFAGWIAVLVAGTFASQRPGWYPALALLTTVAILIPIWILISIARYGLPRSTRQREFGTLTIGLTLSPVLIIIAEVVFIFAIAAFVVLTLGLQDQLAGRFPQLLDTLAGSTSGIEEVETILFNLMQQPLVAAAVFLSLGVFVPLIEEIFKPLAVWLLLTRPLRDEEGYALGLISGGAFALLESAGIVIQMDPQDWLAAIVLRAATGVLHIGLSGLVGFGLVRSRAIRKPGRSILFILAAAGLHGAWNSIALYSGLTVLPVMGERGGDTSNPAAIISILLMALVFASVVIINFFIYRFIKQNIQIEVSTAQS